MRFRGRSDERPDYPDRTNDPNGFYNGETMSKRGKRYAALTSKVSSAEKYTTESAFELIKGLDSAKFDESVDVAVRLGVNPRHADQMVRGACSLPHGTGRGVSVLVFAEGDAATAASGAGRAVHRLPQRH